MTENLQHVLNVLMVVPCSKAASVTQKHLEQLLVLQHDGPFHQILKVRVDPGTDPCVLSDPLLRLDVDVVSHLDRGRGRRLNLHLHVYIPVYKQVETLSKMSTETERENLLKPLISAKSHIKLSFSI